MKNKSPLLFYISVCLTLLLFCSVIFISLLLNKIETDKNRFNTISKQLEKVAVCDFNTIKELSQQRFKEDYYIVQESNNTTLILGVFGVTTILFGLFSYSLFESRVNEYKRSFETNITEQNEKYKNLKIDLNDLLKDIASNSGYENLMKSKRSLVNNEYDWFVYFVLEALSNFSEYYVIIKEQEFPEEFQKMVLNNQINTLKEALVKIENIYNIKDLEPTVTNQYIDNIRRFNSVEINKLISKLYSHLSE